MEATPARKGHHKSRTGCAECKRRRIKCDEGRPICQRCLKSRRACSFPLIDPVLPKPIIVHSPHPHGGALTEDNHHHPSANLEQLGLLHHFYTQDEMFRLFPDGLYSGDLPVTAKSVADDGISCPYLMNEILAFSARHLATVRVHQREHYLQLAKSFQTHALTLFTGSNTTPNDENCIQVLWFSWLLGTHLLCDVTLDENRHHVLEHFLRYMEVYRGTRTVVVQAWEALLNSNVEKYLRRGMTTALKQGTGPQTSSLILLIQESLGLEEKQKEACIEAVATLQYVINEHTEKGLEAAIQPCTHIIFSWPLSVLVPYLEALRARRPEALITLAYFSVLLHWCRNHWIFETVGRELFASIESALGLGWERWLQWPRDMINPASTQASPC